MPAGKRKERITFQRQSAVENVGGQIKGAWADVGTWWAAVWSVPMGASQSEEVMAAKLTGKALYYVKVPRNTRTKAIDSGFRAVDARDARRVWNVRAVMNRYEIGAELVFLVEEGVAT